MMGGGGGGGVCASGSINFSVCTSVIVIDCFSVVVASSLGFRVKVSLSGMKTSKKNYEAKIFPIICKNKPSVPYPL